MYYGYIYKTTNNINNKIYVGQHKGDTFDSEYYGSGKYLTNAINKYGIDNFTVCVLEFCETRAELNAREQFWIKMYNSQDKSVGYNLSSGGDGGDTFTCQPEEIKQEIREKTSMARRGKIGIHKDGHRKYIMPEELDNYLSLGWLKGSPPLSKATAEKMKNSHTGLVYVTNGVKNKKISIQDIESWEANGYRRGFTSTNKMREASTARSEKSRVEKLLVVEEWKKTEHYCLACGKLLTEYIGTGRYCSKSCSATHPHSEETKQHIKELNFEGKCGMRGKHLTQQQRLNHSNSMKGKYTGTKWLTDGVTTIRVPSDDVVKYLEKGFRLGRTGKFAKKE